MQRTAPIQSLDRGLVLLEDKWGEHNGRSPCAS